MDRQYVGIDFHRRRSVIVRKNAAGEKLSSVRVANDPWVIAAAVAEAGRSPEVVIEATYGWYWIVDWLQEAGRDGPFGEPVGVELGDPSGQERRTRRDRSDRHVAPGSPAGGVDRATGDPGVTRVSAFPRQVGGTAVGPQSLGARGDGQRRCAARRERHVRCGRQRPAQ